MIVKVEAMDLDVEVLNVAALCQSCGMAALMPPKRYVEWAVSHHQPSVTAAQIVMPDAPWPSWFPVSFG